VQVAILGPLEVRDDGGEPVVISGARLRDLIARLALAGGRPVSTAALAEAVWGDEPPADLGNALQTLVSRARRALGGPRAVEQSAAGYRLVLGPDDVDAFRFERLLAEGRPEEAMRLWRGTALADAGKFAEPHAQRLQQLQLDATLARLGEEISRGQAAGTVAEVKVLAAQHPLNETLAGLLMRALAATGRQAEALAAYETVRGRLADELGIDPGAELSTLHLQVLRGEASGPPPTAPRPGPAPARTNLRAQLTSFIGREEDAARVIRALTRYRLVTLVGPGGTGKTRLAAEVAAALAAAGADGRVPDGVWLAELASVTDPGDVPQTVLNSIGLRESRLLIDGTQRTASRDARTRLLDGLADANALLVLDNCEHLIEACAHLADALLAHCPRLRIIATSREPLAITGESLLPVAPLGQPTRETPAAAAVSYPAVQLFAERAAAVSPGFAVTGETAGLVIDIVRRLDGMPLAIELAAARLRTLSLPEISRRLSDRFRLLTGGSRTALPRHRTLRAVVEWSWDLLTPAERRLAERFAVFPAGATPGAAAEVCALPVEDQPVEDQPVEDQPSEDQPGAAEVDDLLSSLVDKSLLQPVQAAQGPGETRLRMLETVREYGTEQLSGRGELAELRRRHAEYYSALMAEAAPKLVTREQVAWLPRLQAERDNILAALRFWCDVRDGGQALALVTALSGMTMVLGGNTEVMVDLLGQALAAADGEPVDEDLRTVGEVLYRVSRDMRTDGGKVKLAPDDLTGRVEAIDPARQPLVGLVRMIYAFFLDDRARLNRYVDEAMATGDEWLTAATWMLRASLAENDGDHAMQSAAAEEALRRFRALGERWGLASTLRVTGAVRVLDGDLDGGAAAFTEALTALRELGSRDDEFQLRLQLADLVARRGDLAQAHANYEAALGLAKTDGWGLNEVIVLGSFAMFEATTGNMTRAGELAAEGRRRIGETAANEQLRQHLSVAVEAAGSLVAIAEGDLVLAAERAAAAYSSAVAVSDMPLLAVAAAAGVELSLARGNPARAAELLGAAAVVRGSEDLTSVQFRGAAGRLRAALGDDGFEAAYGCGRALARASALPFLDPANQ
jgi:predicted ATPase/DNA-binding SARP family transcriptional activator